MRPDLYRDPYEEQAQWEALHAEQARKEGLKAQMTPEISKRLGKMSKAYPWMSKGTLTSLVRAGVPDSVIGAAAGIEARAKTEKKNGSMWSGLGDVMRDVGHIATAPVRVAGGAASAVREGIGNFASDAIAGGMQIAGGQAGEQTPQRNPQAAAFNASPTQGYEATKAATRVGLAAAQAPYEAVVGLGREAIAGNLSGNGLMTGLSVQSQADVGGQTTLGAAAEQYRDTGKVDLGKGFFPAGEAAKRQAENARAALSVDGHAATLGRLAANLVTEPGTAPYRVLSGLIDAGTAWYGDPGAQLLKSAGEAGKAARVLSNVENDVSVARAAEKASPEWRAAMDLVTGRNFRGEVVALDEATGLVHGAARPTVVPSVVDKYLYSDKWKHIAEGIAKEESPYKIWLSADKQMDPTVAFELSQIGDAGKVTSHLRPHLGLDVNPGDFKGFGMQVTQSAQRQLRAFNVVPETWLPWDDAETFIRNLDNSLANAKVMGEERRAIMDVAFETLANPSEGRRVRLLNVATDAVKRSLIGYGVDEKTAKELTSWAGDQEKLRAFFVGDLGENVNFPFLLDKAGEPITAAKPAGLMDLLNSGTFLHDPTAVREIRRLTSNLAKAGVTTHPGFQIPVSTAVAAQEEIWKPLKMVRPAFFARVNGEELVRSWASGKYDGVLDWLHFAAFHRGEIDASGNMFDLVKEADQISGQLVEGGLDAIQTKALQGRLQAINDEVLAGKSAYDQVRIGKTTKLLDLEGAEKNMVRSGNWPIVRKDSNPKQWVQGMADEAIRAYERDPVMRRVANGGLFEGDLAKDPRPGLDGIVDWLTEGTGTKFRRQMEQALPGVEPQQMAEQMVDLARKRVDKLAGDQADLREILSTGKLKGESAWTTTKAGSEPTDDFLARMEEWRQDPRSTTFQKNEQLAKVEKVGGERSVEKAIAGKDQVMKWFFGNLYGRTSDYLSRSPVFKAEYWTWMEGHAQYLDEAAHAEMLAAAAKADLGAARMKRLQATIPSGSVAMETADAIAKGRALDNTNALLFSAHEKSQFFDEARILFPFGEAWKEVLGKWATILKENPQVVRRTQQIVQGARGADVNGDGEGFFYRDPATGEEMFGYKMPGPVADFFGGSLAVGTGLGSYSEGADAAGSINVQGSVKGLSLGLSVIPGMGMVASTSMKYLLPNKPEFDEVRKLIFQFGEPGSVASQIAPSWASKLWGAKFPDERSDRVFGNTYQETIKQLVASGDFGTSEDEQQRLLDTAMSHARVIYMMRGVLQAWVPSSPQIQYMAKTKSGDVVAALLAKDFHEMQADDYDTSIEKFTDKYGEDAYAYMVGKTKSTVGGQQASSAYGQWERDNPDLIKKFPLVAGYFGPQGEGLDQAVLSRQGKQHLREARTGAETLRDAQSLLAGWIYKQKSAQVEGRTDQAATDWKRQVKAEIQKDYPGWNPDAIPNNLPGRIRQLQRAVKDPKVAGTDVGEALDIYFQKRSEAIISAKAGGLDGGPFQANAAAPLRGWLRGIGGELSNDFPGFQRVWDEVLSRELKDDTEVAGG